MFATAFLYVLIVVAVSVSVINTRSTRQGRSIALFGGFVREESVKRNRQVSESMQFCQIAINGKKRGEGQQIKK